MHVNEFIKSREGDWKRLEALLIQQTRRRALAPAEIYELGGLYRSVMSDLAIARRDYPDHRLVMFLNQLLTRAHGSIYQEDTGDARRFGRLIVSGIPGTFRETSRFILIAFLLFFVPAVIGFRMGSINPAVAEPLGLADQRDILEQHQTWTDIPATERPFISTVIMSNNIRIAILAFAGGITFGLFTLYILAYNGLIVGALLGLAAHYDMGSALFGFIVGHGVLELSIIFMSGGAGLALAWALLNPGRHTRLDALRAAAERSVNLALLAVPVLIIAGLIEGFISPSDLAIEFKVMIGILTGVLLYAYLFVMGKSKPGITNESL